MLMEIESKIVYMYSMASATGGSKESLDPQFVEKINEFLKFTIDF